MEERLEEIGIVWKEAIEEGVRKKVEQEMNSQLEEKQKEVYLLRERFEQKIAQIKGET